MGKTAKGKDKAKAKVAKMKAKIARKMKSGMAAVVAAFALALLATGCTSAQSSQPAKSQTQNNPFDDCIIVVATQASVSNRVIRADGTKDSASAIISKIEISFFFIGTSFSPRAARRPAAGRTP